MRGKKESFIYLFTKILMGLIGIVSVGIQTKYISPAALGDFSLIIGFTGVLVSVFASWIGSSGLRYYHQYYHEKKENEFYSTLMLDWLVMFGLICLTALIGGWIFTSIPIRQYLSFVLVMLFWCSLWEIYEKLMRASNHNTVYCLILLMQSILNLAIIILYYKATSKEIESLFLAKILTICLSIIIIIIVLRVWKYIKIRQYSWELNKVFFSYGFPMVGVWGVSWLLNYSDRYIINYFLANTQVGLYDVAYRFAESSIGMVISAFNLAFFPAMIRTWNEEGKEAACRMTRSVFNYFFMFAIPAFLGIALLANQFYGTIIDEQYQEAAVVMSISSIGFIFMGINNMLYKLWQLEEKTKMVLYLTIMSVLVNITTNIIFIPLFGYIAAAATTVVSYVLTTIVIVFLIRRHFHLSIDKKTVLKQLVSGAAMSVFILVFRRMVNGTFMLFLCIMIGALIYFMVLALQGGLKNEIQEIKAMLRKKV